jgi:CelD/BcsL family acetyltransferase involved in cellulose biosynthesis
MGQPQATAAIPGGTITTNTRAHGAPALAAYRRFDEVAQAVSRLAPLLPAPPQQSDVFLGLYETHHGGRYLHAALGAPGAERFLLPMEAARRHGVTVLGYVGGRHANGNFPLIDPASALPSGKELAAALVETARKAMPQADVIILERQQPVLNGQCNPLVLETSIPSPNIALSANLSQGFDHLMSVISGKRKRKKNRSQARKLEAAGGYRFVRAATPDDVDRLLGSFFASKEVRFRASGIENVFAPPKLQVFLRDLFKAELGKTEPRFVLDGLDVAGKIRAVTGSSVTGKRITCEFASIAEDDIAYHSPGEFLFFHNIQEAARQGYVTYDFGVGDEHYKRLWCDVETTHFDTILPLTAKGAVYAACWRAQASVKRRVKRSKTLWPLVKRLRQVVHGQRQDTPAPDSDDS